MIHHFLKKSLALSKTVAACFMLATGQRFFVLSLQRPVFEPPPRATKPESK